MKWFKVSFGKSHAVKSCVEIEAPTEFMLGGRTVCLQASDESDAKKRAYNTYCAKKKKLSKDRNYAAGNCACGRKQDREREDGKGYWKTCTVCMLRQDTYDAAYRAKGLTPGRRKEEPHKVRDEAARVEKCQIRMRDRKSEMRLEILVEVQKQWQSSRTNGVFTAWLEREIKEALKPKFVEEQAVV